jgi:hypothetical protein
LLVDGAARAAGASPERPEQPSMRRLNNRTRMEHEAYPDHPVMSRPKSLRIEGKKDPATRAHLNNAGLHP